MSYKNMPEKRKDESVKEWLDRVEEKCPETAKPANEKPILDINAIVEEMEEQ